MSSSLILFLGFGLATATLTKVGIAAGVVAASAIAAIAAEGTREKRIVVSRLRSLEGGPISFTLSCGSETVPLEAGNSWASVDACKWVARGIVEAPQSFRVLPDGSVEINGIKIDLDDPNGEARLEQEINRHNPIPVGHPAPNVPEKTSEMPRKNGSKTSKKVRFKVKLDSFGHVMVECTRGLEHVVTGVRGLQSLIQNGLMLPPKRLHVDPLQRSVEIDDFRIECNEAGTHQLEDALNDHYAPTVRPEDENEIDVIENSAASTGFDLRFTTTRAGIPLEEKGHLSQELLDVLQDSTRCDLLKPGIILRLSPPNLIIRRRRPDGREEKFTELPEVEYLKVTTVQLRQILNHPLIRKNARSPGKKGDSVKSNKAPEIVKIRVTRNPQNNALLWMECETRKGGTPEIRALTHHNVADFQHKGIFAPQLDVSLSLDNGTLSILNKQTQRDEVIKVDCQSPDAELTKAGGMLTAALATTVSKSKNKTAGTNGFGPSSNATCQTKDDPKDRQAPIAPRTSEEISPNSKLSQESQASQPNQRPSASAPEPANTPAADEAADAIRKANEPSSISSSSDHSAEDQIATAQAPSLDATILALFEKTDPIQVNSNLFLQLGRLLELPAQDKRLSLAHVFENRRFEIISPTHVNVTSVMELRSAEFAGFYLSHNNENKIILVYACQGKHLEWGPDKCELQSSPSAEPEEFIGSGLLGAACKPDGQLAFVVSPTYKDWAKSRGKIFEDVQAHLVTANEVAAAPSEYTLIWPLSKVTDDSTVCS